MVRVGWEAEAAARVVAWAVPATSKVPTTVVAAASAEAIACKMAIGLSSKSKVRLKVISHFDILALVYNRIAGFFLGPPDCEMWRKLLELPVNGRLLDAGGGTGRVSASLRPMVGQLVVADISPGMLRQAQKKGYLHPVQTDAALLPFPDDIFERIMAVDSLHHFPRQRQVIRELARVLAPGGLLAIEEFDIRRLPVKGLALIEKLALMGSSFIRPKEIRSLVLEEGLAAEIREGEQFSVFIVAKK